ncbi:hypothetical protein RN001_016015, partial [Aquatica leii]
VPDPPGRPLIMSFTSRSVNLSWAPTQDTHYSPTGKPTITTAHNTSATALFISWRPPHHETIHGEFLGYRISYRPRDHGEEAMRDIYIRDPSAESYIIDRLETYTQYLVSLQVFNPEGAGPKTTVLVMTDEGVSGAHFFGRAFFLVYGRAINSENKTVSNLETSLELGVTNLQQQNK